MHPLKTSPAPALPSSVLGKRRQDEGESIQPKHQKVDTPSGSSSSSSSSSLADSMDRVSEPVRDFLSLHSGLPPPIVRIRQIISARRTTEPEQVQRRIQSACMALSGSRMTESDRTAVLDAVQEALDVNNSENRIDSIICGVGLALGGVDMPEAHYQALLNAIVGKLAARSYPSQMFDLMSGLCRALGNEKMSETHRMALLSAVTGAAASQPNDPGLPEFMINAIGKSLGGKDMSEAHRSALIREVMDTWKINAPDQPAPRQIVAMANGLTLGMGGRNIPEIHRTALLNAILHGPAGSSLYLIGELLYSTAVCLGGSDMPETHRAALISAVIAKSATCSPMKACAMTEAIGNTLFKDEICRTAVLSAILDVPYTLDAEKMELMIKGYLQSLSYWCVSGAERRDATLTAILDASKRCSPEQMSAMIRAVCHSLGNPISEADGKALLDAVLKASAKCSLKQMYYMISQIQFKFEIPMNPDLCKAVYASILRSSASNFKKGLLVAYCAAGIPVRRLNEQKLIQAVMTDMKLEHPEMAATLHPYIKAGVAATTSGQLAELLQTEGVSDDEKLNFIDYMVDQTWSSLSSTNLIEEYGRLFTLQIDTTQVVRVAGRLLQALPVNFHLFSRLRDLQIGRLSKMESTNTEEFATWYRDFRSLYRDCAQHIPVAEIAAEKAMIARLHNLPGSAKETIIELLETRQKQAAQSTGVSGLDS